MCIAASQIIVFLAPLSLLFAFELPPEVFNGLFVVLEPIVTIPDMKNRILVQFHTFHSLLQVFPQLLLLLLEDLQGRKELALVVQLQSSGDGAFVAVVHARQQR